MNIDIRPFQRDDIDILMSWIYSHWELVLWSGHYFGYPLDRTHFESHYDVTMKDPDKRLLFWVINQDTQQPVGYFEYDSIHPINRTAFISRLIVRPDQRREKIGSSILIKILEHGFLEMNFHRMEAVIFDKNQEAVPFFERFGFVLEGTYRDFFKNGDDYWDCYQYAILDEEWEAKRNAYGELL